MPPLISAMLYEHRFSCFCSSCSTVHTLHTSDLDLPSNSIPFLCKNYFCSFSSEGVTNIFFYKKYFFSDQWFVNASPSAVECGCAGGNLQVITVLCCDLLPVLCSDHLCSLPHVPWSHQLGKCSNLATIQQQITPSNPASLQHSPGEIEFKIFIRVAVNSRLSTDTQ